jgi:hypothetical protein
MSKSIRMSENDWEQLRARLKNDYSPSVLLIRSKMRNVLGFTDREYTTWDLNGHFTKEIHLDFFNEPKRTMFLLKYSEYIKL